MRRQLSKNLVSVILITCLTICGVSVPIMSNNYVHADEVTTQAVLQNSKITTPSTLVKGKKFTMTLTGDRQAEVGGTEGETRYVPYSYVITHSSGKIKSPKNLSPNSKGNYSYSIKFSVAGKKTIAVTWKYQKFTNGQWKTVSKKKTSKKITIRTPYKVTLNANGGKAAKKSITVARAKKYNSYQKLPSPTRSGYNFKGWYTKKSGGKKITGSTKVTVKSNQTLYARWQNKYKVTFNANGGTVASSKKTKTVTLAKAYGTLPTPKRTNYVFKGWYTAKVGGIKITKSSVVALSGNQTLYAMWDSGGSIISSYDDAAKTIIARIGTQDPSQCAVYCMSYCTAIRSKIQVAPASYLLGSDAHWILGGMGRISYSSSTTATAHTQAMTVIKNQIDNDLPCVIRTTYGTNGQHWLTVVGYVPNASTYSDLYVLDPAAQDVTQVLLFKDTKYYFPKDANVRVATFL